MTEPTAVADTAGGGTYFGVREEGGKFYVYERAFNRNVSRPFDDEVIALQFLDRMTSSGVTVVGL